MNSRLQQPMQSLTEFGNMAASRELSTTTTINNFACPCGFSYPLEKCFNLNPTLRPEGWSITANMKSNINSQLEKDPIPEEKVRDYGYEFYKCFCGEQNHTFAECFNLCPSKRPENWNMSKSVVISINERLPKNPDLRKYIIDRFGYGHYRETMAKLSSLFPHYHQSPRSPLFNVSHNLNLKLTSLPNEILVRLIELIHRLSLDDLLNSHVVIHFKSICGNEDNRLALHHYPRQKNTFKNQVTSQAKWVMIPSRTRSYRIPVSRNWSVDF